MKSEFSKSQVEALNKALEKVNKKDLCTYLDLKEMKGDSDNPKFRNLFMKYYGMNKLRNERNFLDRFFGFRFVVANMPYDETKNEKIVRELYEFKIKNKNTLQFSFVSKLVSLYDESMPIYDTYVCYFFGRGLYKGTSKIRRINAEIRSYKNFLSDIRIIYQQGANLPKVRIILEKLKEKEKRLNDCHSVRLLDFLIYTAGKESLLE